MKAQLPNDLCPRRGVEPKLGHVYINNKGRPFYKVVVGLLPQEQKRNGVVFIHVAATGDVVGASCQPHQYVKNHHDLIGFVKDMPTLKIEWYRK